MSDNLNNAIKQITDMLSNDPDSLKDLIEAFTNSSKDGEEEISKIKLPEPKNTSDDMKENIEMFTRFKSVMDRMSSNSDPRVNLLTSITPFLSSRRKSRLSSAIKFLRFYPVIQSLLEDQKNNDNDTG